MALNLKDDNLALAIEKWGTLQEGGDATAVHGLNEFHGPLFRWHVKAKMRRAGFDYKAKSIDEILQWLIDHQDEILAVVKFVITIISMFS